MNLYDYSLRIGLCVLAYLIGSINFATLFAKIKKMDITKQGSGNPGTMNVLRTIGKLWGILTFLCDAAKGVIFALLGRYLIGQVDWLYILGVITIIGHMFPIYTNFKGGKGVATSMGIFVVANPIVGLITLVFLIAMLYLFKYGFLGSIITISFLCIYVTLKHTVMQSFLLHSNILITTLVMVWINWALVLYGHKNNFVRLIKGKENTLQLMKKNSSNEQKK